MSEWKEYKLGDIACFSYGRMPKKELINTGVFPIFSGYKYQYLYPENNCDEGDLIIVARGVGGTGDVKIVREKCYLTNLSIKVNLKNGIVLNEFFYYFFNQETLRYLDSGSAQSQITIQDLEKEFFMFPDIETQKSISYILRSLDYKIDLLHRQNATLEKMAETLFRQWFVERESLNYDSNDFYDGHEFKNQGNQPNQKNQGSDNVEETKEEWEEGTLGDVIEIYDNLRVPLSKMERDKKKDGQLYPYYGAAQIMDYINDYIFDGEYILLGEDGTVRTDEGYPVLQYATGKFWVNNHTHVIRAKQPYNNFFIWNYLKKKNIDEIVTGAVQPKINQANLKSIDFPKYPENLVIEFNKISELFFKKINQNKTQIRTLTALRDTLLPKLMSGEVRVNNDFE